MIKLKSNRLLWIEKIQIKCIIKQIYPGFLLINRKEQKMKRIALIFALVFALCTLFAMTSAAVSLGGLAGKAKESVRQKVNDKEKRLKTESG